MWLVQFPFRGIFSNQIIKIYRNFVWNQWFMPHAHMLCMRQQVQIQTRMQVPIYLFWNSFYTHLNKFSILITKYINNYLKILSNQQNLMGTYDRNKCLPHSNQCPIRFKKNHLKKKHCDTQKLSRKTKKVHWLLRLFKKP